MRIVAITLAVAGLILFLWSAYQSYDEPALIDQVQGHEALHGERVQSNGSNADRTGELANCGSSLVGATVALGLTNCCPI
jgi:hypothetical protein